MWDVRTHRPSRPIHSISYLQNRYMWDVRTHRSSRPIHSVSYLQHQIHDKCEESQTLPPYPLYLIPTEQIHVRCEDSQTLPSYPLYIIHDTYRDMWDAGTDGLLPFPYTVYCKIIFLKLRQQKKWPSKHQAEGGRQNRRSLHNMLTVKSSFISYHFSFHSVGTYVCNRF